MLALRTARAWGKTPTEYEKLSNRDKQLCEMLVLHDDALLTRYGVRADQAGDPDTEGWWIVEPTTDYAAKAVAEWEADNETGPGETVTVRLDPDYIPRHRGDRRR